MLPLLLLLSSFLGINQHEWSWSIHPEAHFKVLSPFNLTQSTQKVPTVSDPIAYHQYNGGSVADTTISLALVIDQYQIPSFADSSDYLYHKELFDNAVDQI